MAETPLKRQREEEEETQIPFEDAKRQKSYNQILSFLESDEEEPTQDLSSLITSLQQELSPDSGSDPASCSESDPVTAAAAAVEDYTSPCPSDLLKNDDVIRRLLEASDDELGIPNGGVENLDGGGDGLPAAWSEELWEIEDEAANYYTLLQSELFMELKGEF